MDTQQCKHHWIIDTANGTESRGRCRKCKSTKVFLNSIPEKDIKWAISMSREQ